MGLIKKYETGDLIGEGSMGSVYYARDIVLDREVALKILHTGPDLDPELKERFYREARTAAKLKHPNIVIVYELDEFNGIPFMAMELLKGADIRHYIQEQRPLSLAQKVEFLAQVCDGLAEAHRHGIVHRDVKPSNIYIHEERTAKVLDFGIARLPSSKLTITGKVLGTPNYMSPEQINRRQCDARSDLFSAAMVFYEFFVYAHPFQSTFIPRRIADDEPDSLYDRDPLIPKSLADLLYKALQKKPEERIQTAEDFAVRLRAVLQELRTGLSSPPNPETVIAEAAGSGTNPEPAEDSPSGRVAAFVQLLATFDRSIELGRLDDANEALEVMARLEAMDDRFSEALKDSREKAALLQGRPAITMQESAVAAVAGGGVVVAPAFPVDLKPRSDDAWDDTHRFSDGIESPAAAPIQDPPRVEVGAPQTFCLACGSSNRVEAAYCRECGKELVEKAAPKPAVPEVVEEPVPVASAALMSRIADVLRPPGLKALSAWARASDAATRLLQTPGFSRTQKLTAATVVLGFVLVASVFAMIYRAPVSVVPAVGTAVVQPASTDLVETPTPKGKRLMPLQHGTSVNLLAAITPGDEFARVQFVSREKNSRPGYVRREDLGQWSDANVAWGLCCSNRPADGLMEHEQEWRQFADRLRQFADGYPGPQADKAKLELAKVYIQFAGLRKSAGAAQSEWEQDLAKAKEALVRVTSTDGEVASVQQQIATLEAPDPTPLLPPPAPPKQSELSRALGKLEQKAQQLYHQADWDGVLECADQMAKIDPDNEKADWWKKKIALDRKALFSK